MGELVEKILLEDGRRAERHINETETEKVVELHVESERPLHIQQRLIERKKPIIYERTIETLDETGQIIDRKVESLEPNVQMELRSHIARTSVNNEKSITKDDLQQALTEVLKVKNNELPTPVKLCNPVQENALSWSTMAIWGVILVEIAAIAWVWFAS